MTTEIQNVSPRVNGRLLLAPVNEASDLSLVVHKTTAASILNAAKVDWTVSKRPLYLPDGRVMPGAFALVRDDNQSPLSVVGRQYQPNQNTAGLSAFDRLVEGGLLEGYTNAGIFAGGKLAWIQAQVKTFSIGQDEIRGMLTLTISHGSQMTDRWGVCATRVICRNTFMSAARDLAKNGLVFGHTAKGNAEYSALVSRIHSVMAMLSTFREQGETMRSRSFNRASMVEFAAELFPGHAASSRLENMRTKVIDLYEVGSGNTTTGVRGTRWAAFNAVTEYADHFRSTRKTGEDSEDESRLSSAWFGSGAQLKQRAMDLLLA